MKIARINDEIITAESWIKQLKLCDEFSALIEKTIEQKLTVHAAKKAGISVTTEEIQARIDHFRRVQGLHRAQDTYHYLEDLGIDLDDLERFAAEEIYREKMYAQIVTGESIEDYFRLHSPKFESLEISHIVVDTKPKARELMSLLEEEPEQFADYAREHSLDNDTRAQGGLIGRVQRGSLNPTIESKLFNAEVGEPLGPFTTEAELVYEIYLVNARHPARLDEDTKRKVAKTLYDEWLRARAEEHVLEVA